MRAQRIPIWRPFGAEIAAAAHRDQDAWFAAWRIWSKLRFSAQFVKVSLPRSDVILMHSIQTQASP